MICQNDNAEGEAYPFVSQMSKTACGITNSIWTYLFFPFNLTSCLCVASDLRVYSQLSLPIWRLSAYTVQWRLFPQSVFEQK